MYWSPAGSKTIIPNTVPRIRQVMKQLVRQDHREPHRSLSALRLRLPVPHWQHYMVEVLRRRLVDHNPDGTTRLQNIQK